MRSFLVALPLLLGTLVPMQTEAAVSVGIGIGLPGINIGINVPVYPTLVRVPGYPVYYDPRADSNYFFYDGLYWVYRDDNWYQSSWYNGPWQSAAPEVVPVYVLRVPVRYYRQPPIYFRGWASSSAPRWGEHWGREWEVRRVGWDRWDHRVHPVAAPLPVYQRQYSGDRYPREVEQQHVIRSDNYRYQPREAVARQTFEQHARPGTAGSPHADASVKAPAAAPPQDQGQDVKAARLENKEAEQAKRRGDKAAAQEGRQRNKDEAHDK